MSVLVVAEHDNRALKPATLHAMTAASEIAGTGRWVDTRFLPARLEA